MRQTTEQLIYLLSVSSGAISRILTYQIQLCLEVISDILICRYVYLFGFGPRGIQEAEERGSVLLQQLRSQLGCHFLCNPIRLKVDVETNSSNLSLGSLVNTELCVSTCIILKCKVVQVPQKNFDFRNDQLMLCIMLLLIQSNSFEFEID